MQQNKRIAYRFDGFHLDPVRRILSAPDRGPIALKPRAFDTLLYLAEHAGLLIERQELLNTVWSNVVVHPNNLDQAISGLRRALGESRDDHRFIVTVPGRGYRFVARVETIPLDDAEASAADSREAPMPPGPAVADRRSRIWSAAAAALAVVAIASWVLAVRERVSDPPALRLTPLSSEGGGQRSAVWSPDGTSVAFAARTVLSEQFQVYLRRVDSPEARRVTDIASNPLPKQWTASDRLLYLEPGGLWSASPAGAPPELVGQLGAVPSRFADSGVDVTRDGSALAMLRVGDEGVFGVWTAALPDAALEAYEPAPFAAARVVNKPFLRFSPDGRQLLLIRNAGGGEQAWLLPFPPDPNRPPRRTLERLLAGTGPVEFSWLPDNRHVVVSAAAEARRQLYVADTQSDKFHLLAGGQMDKVAPVVSPDGDKVVFADVSVDFDVVTLDLTSGVATPLIATRRLELMPAWASAAEALVYVTDRNGAMEIWLHQTGQLDRPVVSADDFSTGTQWFIAPALSPDGTRVIYQRVGSESGTARLWMSAVAGGVPQRVTSNASPSEIELGGSWSPDGAWFVYLALEPNGSTSLKKVRTTGQAEHETVLADIGGGPVLPVWSPDGEWILIADRGMKLVSPDGATILPLGIENSACAFAHSEALLYCIRAHREDGAHAFVAMDFAGNIVRRIGSVPPGQLPASSLSPGLRLSPSPDGSGVTYAIGRTSQDLWLMEGLSAVMASWTASRGRRQ